MQTPGEKLRQALKDEHPLQVVGTVNAYIAIMAKKIGYRALFLSGAGVANYSYGLPDIGVTTLDNVLEDLKRITAAVDLPIIVDVDTGWGSAPMIQRTVKEMTNARAAAIQIEDQVFDKRCGHLSGKEIVSQEEMVDRIKTAVSARSDASLVIVARTDALAIEGLDATIARAKAYKEAGADVIFPEAFFSLDQYRAIKKAVQIPIMANITEFGKTPLFTLQELRSADVDIALYPVTINRIMCKAAKDALQEIRSKGTQKDLVDRMQTREELYKYLDYSN